MFGGNAQACYRAWNERVIGFITEITVFRGNRGIHLYCCDDTESNDTGYDIYKSDNINAKKYVETTVLDRGL